MFSRRFPQIVFAEHRRKKISGLNQRRSAGKNEIIYFPADDFQQNIAEKEKNNY
jgi:hypothetical protein